jgi:iron complex transport system substrate-binding protein
LHRRLTVTLFTLLALVGIAACGSDDDPVAASGDSAAESTTSSVAPEEAPERIVSISPSATEMLFAIGAGDQVVAVDDNSNYPADVPTTDLSSFEPNVEAIAEYDPDLVVTSSDAADLVDGLETLDIAVLVQLAPTEIDQVYDQITELGDATGHADEAGELVSDMQSDLDEIAADVDAEGLTYYYELDPTFYSLTGQTFIGKLLGTLGLESIADAAESDVPDYPQLSAEHVIQSDPDLVLLADTKCCQQNAASLAARPGWAELSAVKGNHVVELDDDVASRWGPRLVDLLRQVAKAAGEVEPAE